MIYDDVKSWKEFADRIEAETDLNNLRLEVKRLTWVLDTIVKTGIADGDRVAAVIRIAQETL